VASLLTVAGLATAGDNSTPPKTYTKKPTQQKKLDVVPVQTTTTQSDSPLTVTTQADPVTQSPVQQSPVYQKPTQQSPAQQSPVQQKPTQSK